MPLPRSILRLTDEELDDLLTSERTLRIGTVGPEGGPHVAPMWFVWHEGAIWLNSLIRSRRTSDLASGSQVALCVDAGTDYFELRGAVLYGTPKEVSDDGELTQVRRLFGRKYWNIDEIPNTKSHVWLKVVPDKIASWDFKKIPANKDPRLKYGPTGKPS